MKFKMILIVLLSILTFVSCSKSDVSKEGNDGSGKYRVVVSSDIGGTDPDDFQSMIHLLLYADTLEIEGLIASPFGPGRKEHILEVIDCYEKDYPNLKTYSDYPTPDALREITKQGGNETPDPVGVGASTEGSNWIIECARRDDPRLLHVLVWGGIEDLAQALYDAPDILPKLRVYWIGGPNKKWAVNAYQYIATHHKDLWIIESNATYRGWFVGGDQSEDWGNTTFVTRNIVGHGAMGDHFETHLGGTIKMGDTPSVAWLLKGNPEDPSQPSWGGQYVHAWERPHYVFDRITTSSDKMEEFGVLELRLPFDPATVTDPAATLKIDRDIPGLVSENTVRFLFSPKKAGKFDYSIDSNIPSLNGKKGSITSYLTPEDNKNHPSKDLPNWWTDDPSKDVMEQGHIGVKTVSQWRVEFLTDFAARMDRCMEPASFK